MLLQSHKCEHLNPVQPIRYDKKSRIRNRTM